MENERLFTVEETAERLRVHPETVRRWLRDGILKGNRLTRRAGWRIAESEVVRFAAGGGPEGKLAA